MSSSGNIRTRIVPVRLRAWAVLLCAFACACMLACPLQQAVADEAAAGTAVAEDANTVPAAVQQDAASGDAADLSDAGAGAAIAPAPDPAQSADVASPEEEAQDAPSDLPEGQLADAAEPEEQVLEQEDSAGTPADDALADGMEQDDAWEQDYVASTAAQSADLPAQFDAREQGWLTSVRQQNPWGSCWAIAAVQAMETNLIKQGKATTDMALSPRHLLVFAGTPVSAEGAVLLDSGVQPGQLASQSGEGQHPAQMLVDLYGDNAVLAIGGNYYVVYQTVASGAAPVLESLAPYRNDEGRIEYGVDGSWYSSDGTWTLDESMRYAGTIQLNNVEVLRSPARYREAQGTDSYYFDAQAAAAMKAAIVEYGSVVIAYDSNGAYYDEQNNTFFTSDSRRDNHGVQVVGWDDSVPRTLFTTGTGGALPEGDGAWIVRNSWGGADSAFPNKSDWGDGGYFYLSYYDRSIQAVAAYDVILSSDPEATDIINQYDFFGQMGQASSRLESTNLATRSANVFTAEQTQVLRAVSVDTYVPNTQVTVEIYLLDPDAALPGQAPYDPTQGTLLERISVNVENAGYHRIQLQNGHTVQKGQRFSVVQSVIETREDGTRLAVVSIEAGNARGAQEAYGYYHYDTVVLNPGESFFYGILADGDAPRWMDATVLAAALSAASVFGTPYGNFLIKVFSDAVRDPDPAPDPAPAPAPQPAPSAPSDSASGGAIAVGDKPAAQVQAAGLHAPAGTGDGLPALVLALLAASVALMVGARLRAR